MTRINYDETAGLKDPMPADNFELVFGNIPNYSGATRNLTIRAQQAVIPGMNNDVMPVTLHGFDFIFSGKNTWPKTLTVAFVESSQDMEVMTAIGLWQQAVRGTKSGTSLGYSSQYSADLRLNVYDSPGNLAKSVLIKRAMPQDRPDIQLDSTSTQAMLQNITFGYWKAIIDGITER